MKNEATTGSDEEDLDHAVRTLSLPQLEAARRLVKHYGGHDLRVFGSVSRGDSTPESDLDLLVGMPRGYDMLRQLVPMQTALERLFDRRVDLVVEHELNHHIRQQVLDEARPL